MKSFESKITGMKVEIALEHEKGFNKAVFTHIPYFYKIQIKSVVKKKKSFWNCKLSEAAPVSRGIAHLWSHTSPTTRKLINPTVSIRKNLVSN